MTEQPKVYAENKRELLGRKGAFLSGKLIDMAEIYVTKNPDPDSVKLILDYDDRRKKAAKKSTSQEKHGL